jgi:hypothetical protein
MYLVHHRGVTMSKTAEDIVNYLYNLFISGRKFELTLKDKAVYELQDLKGIFIFCTDFSLLDVDINDRIEIHSVQGKQTKVLYNYIKAHKNVTVPELNVSDKMILLSHLTHSPVIST